MGKYNDRFRDSLATFQFSRLVAELPTPNTSLIFCFVHKFRFFYLLFKTYEYTALSATISQLQYVFDEIYQYCLLAFLLRSNWLSMDNLNNLDWSSVFLIFQIREVCKSCGNTERMVWKFLYEVSFLRHMNYKKRNAFNFQFFIFLVGTHEGREMNMCLIIS